MHSNGYIFRFVLIMTTIVAVVLALMSTGLKGIHDKNEAVYNKRAILASVSSQLGTDLAKLSDDDVQKIFNEQIEQKVIDLKGNEISKEQVIAAGYKGGMAEHIDMSKERKKPETDRLFPMYVFKKADGKKLYIVSVRGNGLWDEIWGNVALDEDLNTIAGVSFDHKAETPGLGAEIKDNAAFPAAFVGKKLYDETGAYKSVDVVKGGVSMPNHQVDAISGATITTVGVGEMMIRGIKYYEPSFSNIKK